MRTARKTDKHPPYWSDRFIFPIEKQIPKKITEAWIYTAAETAIHGRKEHYALDVTAPPGTLLSSPMDGYAFASLQLRNEIKEDGSIIGYGAGYFVEIVAPDGIRIQLMHMQSIDPSLYFHPPIQIDEQRWEPFEKLDNRLVIPDGQPIQAGQRIGLLGHSGLAKDCIETPLNAGKLPSWDEDHVHIWVGNRDSSGNKCRNIDPFAIYGDNLTTYNKLLTSKARGMWQKDELGYIRFADAS